MKRSDKHGWTKEEEELVLVLGSSLLEVLRLHLDSLSRNEKICMSIRDVHKSAKVGSYLAQCSVCKAAKKCEANKSSRPMELEAEGGQNGNRERECGSRFRFRQKREK